MVKIPKRNIVGSKIRQARLAAKPKITQAELSARLQVLGVDISDSAIGKMEHGVSAINDIQLRAFAKALNVTVAWLMDEEKQK